MKFERILPYKGSQLHTNQQYSLESLFLRSEILNSMLPDQHYIH
jgi:hypothetical protein